MCGDIVIASAHSAVFAEHTVLLFRSRAGRAGQRDRIAGDSTSFF
jgi:hypothetical protein